MSGHEISGRLYDGKQSAGEELALRIDADGNVYVAGAEEALCHVEALQVNPRLGNVARHIGLPGGITFETRQNDEVDALVSQWLSPKAGLLHRLESSWRIALASVLGLVLFGYLTVTVFIPALSGPVTAMLPRDVDRELGQSVLPQLDDFAFAPTELSVERQLELEDLFVQLLPPEGEYQLLFRQGKLTGANAFALPDGTVVITDELVALAQRDGMIGAVLLHEIGHVEKRHSVQNLVRHAAVSALVLGLTGDVSTASSLVVLLPTLLLQAGYSREFEREADDYALENMLARGQDPNDFADMMAALTSVMEADESDHAQQGDTDVDASEETFDEDDESEIWDYLSSHPPSEERIRRFREAANTQ